VHVNDQGTVASPPAGPAKVASTRVSRPASSMSLMKAPSLGRLRHVIRSVLDPPAGADCWSSSEHSLAAAARS